MRKKVVLCGSLCCMVIAFLLCNSCTKNTENKDVRPELVVDAGYWENSGDARINSVIELKKSLSISDDEFVVFYLRDDKEYDPFGLWIWAIKGGDGGKAWPYTQEWSVKNGIGYMRLKLDGSTTGGTVFSDSDGAIGLIVREDTSWAKDGSQDRLWNLEMGNACVIFSGDDDTYRCGAYKPRITKALLEDETHIEVTLSTRYGLASNPGEDSGFSIVLQNGETVSIADTRNASLYRKNNYARKVLIELSNPIKEIEPLKVMNADFEAPFNVDTTEFAWKNAEKTIPRFDEKLGCLYDSKKDSAVFKLWSPSSKSVALLLYNDAYAQDSLKEFEMHKDCSTGLWSTEVKNENIDGLFYTYKVENTRGCNEVLDPYARSMAVYCNEGGCGRSAIVDLESERALPQAGFSAEHPALKERENAIIYEISVRDFTISKDAGVKSPGTYSAFAEKLGYLKDLGITHIQLQPVMNFYYTDEMNQNYENSGTASSNNYNWGYDPHNYFTPEGWYSKNPEDPYARVSELRYLIDTAHRMGLGVILDCVYNHTATTALFEDIEPGYYYRMKNGKYLSNSGCGNDTASERSMVKKLIVDSTKHWVQNYHVDGFRFDLMGLIESSVIEDSYDACQKLYSDVLFVGEGWKMYNGPIQTKGLDQTYMKKTDKVAVFNDELRDAVKAGGFSEAGKGFITNKPVAAKHVFTNMCGCPELNYKADDPGDNVQYLVCHDGLTLHDSISYNAHLNDNVLSEKKELIRRIKLGNVIALSSQGIAFLHGGQERGRTKPKLNSKSEILGNYVRNSYDASDSINQFVWTLDSCYQNLYEYTKGLIALRKMTGIFTLSSEQSVSDNVVLYEKALSGTMYQLAFKIHDVNGDSWYIAMNAGSKPVDIDFGENLDRAEVFVDAQTAGTTPIVHPVDVSIDDTSVHLEPYTAALFKIQK